MINGNNNINFTARSGSNTGSTVITFTPNGSAGYSLDVGNNYNVYIIM